jgi:hypothetical protein
MKKATLLLVLAALSITLVGCGVRVNYNLSGASVGTAKSFQVNFFQNVADQSPGSTIEPGLDRDFTMALQDLIVNQTSLSLTGSGADLIYEGEIVAYNVQPMTATANQIAAQNRLNMAVNVRFYNKTKEDAAFEKRFSFFYDFPANSLLESVKSEAHEVLFERITQDIFNASLADW